MSLQSKKTLLLTKATDGVLNKSGRNIARLEINAADKASTYDIVNNQVLLIQQSAVDVLQQSLKN